MVEPSLDSEMDDAFVKIQDYFWERAHLANLHSEFGCDSKCSRPGCKSPQIQVAATIFDVIGAAACQNKSLLNTLVEGFVLGLLPVDGQDWIARVALKIRKPCPYLRNEMCKVYKVRPLACMLFPERSFVAGTAKDLSRQAHFRDYVCLRLDCRVSQERAQVIKKLTGMLQQEILISDSYLFGCSPFLLDLRDLMASSGKQAAMPEENSIAGVHFDEPFTIQQFDNLFRKIFSRYDPFAAIEKKVAELEGLAVRRGLFEYLQNKRAMKRLVRRCYDSQRMFRLVGGVLKAKRMSLIPPECRFL